MEKYICVITAMLGGAAIGLCLTLDRRSSNRFEESTANLQKSYDALLKAASGCPQNASESSTIDDLDEKVQYEPNTVIDDYTDLKARVENYESLWDGTLQRIKILECDINNHEYLNAKYRNKVDSLIAGKARYDPNDGIYKFIPEAPGDWTSQFGVNERTRLIHSISELRVVVATQAKRILALEAKLQPQDLNSVSKDKQ